LTSAVKSSWVLVGGECVLSLEYSRLWAYCKLRGNSASYPAALTPQPVFACTSFLPPLSSPEEDLPWQGPEEKEGEGCRNKSCHSTGTLEPFLSLAAKVRVNAKSTKPSSKLGCPQEARGARLGVVLSFLFCLFSSALSLPVKGQNYSPENDPDKDNPTDSLRRASACWPGSQKRFSLGSSHSPNPGES
jgi:hypothetical protein